MSRTENEMMTASPRSERYHASLRAEKPKAAPAMVRPLSHRRSSCETADGRGLFGDEQRRARVHRSGTPLTRPPYALKPCADHRRQHRQAGGYVVREYIRASFVLPSPGMFAS